MLLKEKHAYEIKLEAAPPPKILYILRDIQIGLSKIPKEPMILGLILRKRRRNIELLQNLLSTLKILIVYLSLMLKPKVVMITMLLIKKEIEENSKKHP